MSSVAAVEAQKWEQPRTQYCLGIADIFHFSFLWQSQTPTTKAPEPTRVLSI
jgi:hypothetical protein